MKRYMKTALITSMVMLVLTGGIGVLLGKLYFDNKEAEKSRTEEEMDMNLYGFTQVEIKGAEVYELKLKGKEKNVKTFSFDGAKEIYNVTKSAKVKEELEQMKRKNTYSVETPLWAYNPFGTNKLSLYMYFKTPEAYSVKYTIHTEDKATPDFTRNLYSSKGELLKEHEYQITGLVPGEKNYILLYLYNKKGELAKQMVYSITPATPKDAPQLRLSGMEGKSSEKLATGLYVFMGEDICFYDNSGVLRAMLPMVDSKAVNLIFVDGQMVYNYSKNGFATVDALGQVTETYSMKNYKVAGDFSYDGYGNLFVLASHIKAKTTSDRIVSIDMRTGKEKEVLDFAKIFPAMKKKASQGSADKLNWLNLNSIAMIGADSVVVSAKELSSIIKVNGVNSEKPSVDYILSQDTVWRDSEYESLLYSKTASEEGDKLFKSQFGQSSLEVIKDAAAEQYYITMLNHNYGHSSTRKDLDWAEVEGVGTRKKDAAASKYYQYYVDEEAAMYMLSDSFNVPYSTGGSLFSYKGHFIVNTPDAKCVNEYDKEGRLIRGLSYSNKSKPAVVQKQDMKAFWYR